LQKVSYIHPIVFSREGPQIVLCRAVTRPAARSVCGEWAYVMKNGPKTS